MVLNEIKSVCQSLFVKNRDLSIELVFVCLFHILTGTLKGEKLLDIGTGPAVYPVITASKWFDEIYLSDISKANVEFLQKWRHGESEPMKYLMEYFARKE